MEQYAMPKDLDFENLKCCLTHYKPISFFVRLKGASGGGVKVSEDLSNKTLSFRKDKNGLHFFIDKEQKIHFPLKWYDKGFSLAYERVDSKQRPIDTSSEKDPYNSSLPEPRVSILRNVLDNQLIEIIFDGRIHLKFHSWWKEPHWKYWTVIPLP